MPNQNASLDVNAKTVDEAIEQGLKQLGLSRDQVEIKIISEGKRGIFGLGSEEAVVRLVARNEPDTTPEKPAAAAPVEPAAVQTETVAPEPEAKQPEPAEMASKPKEPAPVEPDEDDPITLARTYLSEMLSLMNIQAEVVPRPAPDLVENEDDPPPTVLDITGNDLGILIGRRSETLQALQYMIRLMVSKDMGSWQRIIVDVESYRSRRRNSLQKMAQRMAERALSNGERVVLEAMTPYERRIIHIALRDHPRVYTKSIGRENNRKVTIIPK